MNLYDNYSDLFLLSKLVDASRTLRPWAIHLLKFVCTICSNCVLIDAIKIKALFVVGIYIYHIFTYKSLTTNSSVALPIIVIYE